MSEKRFILSNFASPSQLSDVCDGGGKMLNSEVVDLLNEQQNTIQSLQDLCGKFDYENAKLRIENKKLKAKLKEKEEDERLFKDLGGDY